MPALQHIFGQPLWPGGIWQAFVEYVLHRRVAARHDIADHDHVRCRLQMRRLVALHERDAERFELRRHRRPGIGVGTGDRMTGFARDRRDAGHEGAADAEDMDAHVAAQPPAPNSMPATEPATATKNSRSEEHTSELQSLMRISYAVFCLKTKHHAHHQS